LKNRFYRLVDRIQFFSLLLAIFLVPLVFFIGEQNSIVYNLLRLFQFDADLIAQGNQNIVLLKPILAQLLIYFAFATWLIEALERNEFKLPSTSLNELMVGWLWWMILTILFVSPFWYFSIEEMGRYLAMILLFFLVQKLIYSKGRLKWTLWTLFAAAILSTGLGWLQFLGHPLYDWGQGADVPLVSTFGNPNFLAGFLLLTTPVIAGYLLGTKKLPMKIVLSLLVAAQVYLIFATGTRTAFLGLLVAVGIFVFLTFRFFIMGTEREIPAKWFGIAVILILVILAAVVYINPEGIIEDLAQVPDLQRGTQRVRWIMWTGSTRAALDKPLTGHGHGIFQLVFPNYRPRFYHRFRVSHNTRHSHNEFMEVIMETGVIGLAFFLLVMVVFSVLAYRFLYRSRSTFYSWLIIGLTSSIYGSLAQNFASVNLRWMSSTFTFWLIFSLTIAAIRIACDHAENRIQLKKKQTSKRQKLLPPLSWRTGFHVVIGLIFLITVHQFYEVFMGDLYLKQMNTRIHAVEAGQPGVDWTFPLESGERSIEYNPYHLSALYKLAYVNLQLGNYQEAGEAYDRLTDLAPNYAQVHNNVALVHDYEGNPYRKLLHFEWATRLEDNRHNRFNMMEQHRREGLPERLSHHGLFVPRIAREDIYDKTHLASVNLADRNFDRFDDRREAMTEASQDALNSYTLLEEEWPVERRDLEDLLALWPVLEDPAGEMGLSVLARRQDRGRPPSPLTVLGAAERLKELPDEQAAGRRQQYLQLTGPWVNELPDQPLWQLAYAHLLAQTGEVEDALQLVEPHEDEWADDERLLSALEYIRQQAGDPG